jgi:sec-independent protein translocase protein TatA
MLPLAFMNIGGQELILILLIILVLFGARKLPELARGMGQAIKEFQKAKDEFSDELHTAGKTDVAANTDVRPAGSTLPATIPRIENAAGDSVVRPTATETVEPGSKA